jgi:prolipoprotein diacylglyceryltransferase
VLGGFVGGYLFIRVRTWMQLRALKKVTAKFAGPSDIQERGGWVYLRFPNTQDENLKAIARQLAGEVVEEESRKRVRVPSFTVGALADVSAPAVILAMAVGRIGDIINGEHVSKSTTMPWGFVYTNPASPTNQQWGVTPTHPTMVYEMLWDLAVFGVLWLLRGRIRPPGILFAIMLAGYSIGRFFISFLRIDKVWLSGLNEAQLISLVVLAIMVPLLAYRAQLVRGAKSVEKKAKAASAK